MLAVARRFLPRAGDAEDAVQDAFLSVYRSIPQFAGECRLGTWLHRIAVNASLMKLRARRRRPERRAERTRAAASAARAAESGGEASALSAEKMAQAETRARVRASIAQVPEGYRTVLLLCEIEGMRIRDVSRLLSLSPGTVKMRLHRARHRLRALLEPFMREDAP